MDETRLEGLVDNASRYDADYLYYLLGGQLAANGYAAQGAGGEAEAGKSFLARWRREFKALICGKNGVYQQFIKGMVSKKDIPKLIAIAILTGTPAVGGIVITELAAVYLGLLIAQAGIAAYCAMPDD